MSALPTRYAPHIALLCALTLIPVVVHGYLGRRTDECLRPELFAPESRALAPLQDRAGFMRRHFGATRWREGRVQGDGPGPDLRYAIVRSHDPKLVYHRPDHVFLDGTPSGHRTDRTESPAGRALPVHRALYAPARAAGRTQDFAAWILLYDGEAVANPVLAQLGAAWKLVFSGVAPMTLVMVYGQISPREQPPAEARALAFLGRTFDEYRRLCLEAQS